jgi:hypothetical protein
VACKQFEFSQWAAVAVVAVTTVAVAVAAK